MISISEKLENYFFNNVDNCDHELIKLLSLETKECEMEYQTNPDRFERYFKIEEPITESDSESEEEPEKVNIQMKRSGINLGLGTPTKDEGSSSYNPSKKNKQSEFKMPMHNGIPNSRGNTAAINVLNIDCITNLKERKILLDKWITEISLIIQTNPEDFARGRQVSLLLEHKTDGILQRFIRTSTWNLDLQGQDLFDQAIKTFYLYFLGIDYAQNEDFEKALEKQNAELSLTKLQLLDLCHLNDFNCLYEKYLYEIPNDNNQTYRPWVLSYLMKLPIISKQCIERFNEEATTEYTQSSLAFAIRIAKEEIEKICLNRFQQQKLKRLSKSCCDNIAEMQDLTIGKKQTFFKQKKKKYKKYKTFYKKKRKPFRPGKYFHKTKNLPKKTNNCPQGKKKCRCWICSEEGHYANECPNRAKHKDQVKMLISAYTDGFSPLEEEYEEEQQVFYLKIITPSTSEEENDTGSD